MSTSTSSSTCCCEMNVYKTTAVSFTQLQRDLQHLRATGGTGNNPGHCVHPTTKVAFGRQTTRLGKCQHFDGKRKPTTAAETGRQCGRHGSRNWLVSKRSFRILSIFDCRQISRNHPMVRFVISVFCDRNNKAILSCKFVIGKRYRW